MVRPWRLYFASLRAREDIKPGSLAGKMGVVIDLVTRLPVEIWFHENQACFGYPF